MLCASFTFTPTSACAAGASNAPPITRTVLERRPIPGSDQSMELILVTFQPGVSAPLHHHPVAGLNYIIEGTAESAYGHDVPKLYRAGDTLQDLPNVPHTVFRNPDKSKVLRFLIFTNLHADQAYTTAP
ncbi:cupin domain-containing protein [Dyella acidisoli]